MEFPGNMQELFAQAQQMQEKMKQMQEEASKKEVEASAGGGMVTARVNGEQKVVSIKIDPNVVNSDDIEMLQDLVCAAVNEGVRKSKDILKDELSKLTGGIPIPGFNS